MSQVTVTVSGQTGSGKSAIAGEIEIALKAIGVPVVWEKADREHWTHGNEYWIKLYHPEVTIIEQNVSRKPPMTPAERNDMKYIIATAVLVALCVAAVLYWRI